MIDLLYLRGTGETVTMGSGVSGSFLAALDDTKFRVVPVDYPASFGGEGQSWVDSREEGRAALLAAVRNSPNRVVVGGYSQGAGIAGDLCADIASGHPDLRDLEVEACALIADPSRPEGKGLGVPPPGWGICGQRLIDSSIPAYWVAAFADPITALPPNSLLRALPDIVQYWGLRSPQDVARWGQSLIDILRERQCKRWLAGDPSWQECADSINEVDAFVFQGRHTSAYVDEGLCKRLAMALNEAVGV